MANINERQKSEEAFFDAYANAIDIEKLAKLPLFSPHAFENRYIKEVLGSVAGLRVVDIGCGWGEDAVWFAEQGGRVAAIDISGKSLSLARRLAQRRGVEERVSFLRSTVESLPLPDDSFDVAFGRGTLHHADVDETLREVYRVLKPGGVACFSEPLASNPVLNVYRLLNRAIRSPMEAPLRMRDLPRIERAFDSLEHREFKLVAMGVLAWYYIATKLSGTFYTGWFRDLDSGLACRRAYRIFQIMDGMILRACPWLGRWCWLTVIVGRKA